ncbi:MAG: GntR family transcriptional regulator [Eubacteriales bacterium]|jgi:DNA-binding GntR family transcriptional regulator
MQPTTPLQYKAYEAIKQNILQGVYQPGQMYSETRIAGELGISRTPVRDAILRLSQERYLDILPNRGFVLHQLTKEDVEQTIQMRCAIEGHCSWALARECDTPAARKTLKLLRSLVERQHKLMDRPKALPDFLELDSRFHTTLVDFSGNPHFRELFDSYLHRFRDLAAHSLSHPGRMEQTWQEHEAMVQAMEAGDPAAAYQATLLHMESPREISIPDPLA